jgi:hypothetical protein
MTSSTITLGKPSPQSFRFDRLFKEHQEAMIRGVDIRTYWIISVILVSSECYD